MDYEMRKGRELTAWRPTESSNRVQSPPRINISEAAEATLRFPSVREPIHTFTAPVPREEFTEEQQGAIKELHSQVSDIIDEINATSEERERLSKWADVQTCKRYLAATKWNFVSAAARLKATMEW
ncbi:hypothetical protein BC830DRAFT_604308 [Chytriomyces sp. MP71]|nr:hypothetical protein BC830DRAFT_604308 [Chytriomyces sp. MP71]